MIALFGRFGAYLFYFGLFAAIVLLVAYIIKRVRGLGL